MSNFDQRLQAGWRIWSDDGPTDSDQSQPIDPRWMRELDQIAGTGPKKTRTLPIKLLAPLLIDAQQRNSAWLDDFADDEVVIDADLHEVLLACQKLNRIPEGQAMTHQSRRAA